VASRTENAVVNVAGLVQGIVLVTFPALSTIFTKRVYLIGLACSTVSMRLLIASTGVKTDQAAAYPLLLVATRHQRPLTQDAVSPHPAEHGSEPHPNPP
jgi:hypothetical protein